MTNFDDRMRQRAQDTTKQLQARQRKVQRKAQRENIIKITALTAPTVLITLAANYAAVYGGIQSLSLIPAALHVVVIIVGFILLIPLNFAVVAMGLTLGMLLYALVGGVKDL